jgi:hypothetical protein
MASPSVRSPRVGLAPSYARSERRVRRPQHPFNVITKPFQVQPVMCAPVLPGETLKSLLIQSQVWSDPLSVDMKNTGWWCEYNVWYCKHRDLLGFEVAVDGLGKDLIDMFVSNESLSGHQEAAAVAWSYCAPGGIDFVKNCLARVVDEYYRDEGEAWNDANKMLDSVPLAQIYGKGRSDAFDKLTLASGYADHRQKLDADNDGTIYVGDEMNRAFQEWAAAHDAGLVDMTYEDWMRTYGGRAGAGVEPDRVDYHRPEDLGYFRQFAYPNNTVEPSTGVPAVAIGWRVASQLKKSFAFQEPGWILVTNLIRPKVYLENQEGLVAGMMQTRNSWLPAILNDETTVSHLLIDDATGPLKTAMDAGNVDYWLDLRDLLNFGEQFINYTPTGASFMELPLSTGVRRYAASTEIMEMFSNTTTGRLRQDGMISLNILGRQQERTQNLALYKA